MLRLAVQRKQERTVLAGIYNQGFGLGTIAGMLIFTTRDPLWIKREQPEPENDFNANYRGGQHVIRLVLYVQPWGYRRPILDVVGLESGRNLFGWVDWISH